MSKLNRLVAERCMGYKWYQVSPNWYELGSPIHMENKYKDGNPPDGVWTNYSGPMFDTNVDDAMEVFDKFTDAVLEKEGGVYVVVLNGRANGVSHNKCVAICLAALSAVGMTDAEIGEALR